MVKIKKSSEKEIAMLKAILEDAIKNHGDLTLDKVWSEVNKAAHALECVAITSGFAFTTPRMAFLLDLAKYMRKHAEKKLGPQPGYGPTKTIPKKRKTKKLHS